MAKCRSCRAQAVPGKARCEKHLRSHRDDTLRRLATRQANGQCGCGQAPASGKRRCQACIDKQREAQSNKRANGFCIRCSKGTLAVAAGMCERCWFKKIAADTTGARGAQLGPAASGLKALWLQQGGTCAISGDILAPGINASIDHIMPRASGGSNDISNLQWVTFHVNLAKHVMSNDEFIAMCERVSARKKEGR